MQYRDSVIYRVMLLTGVDRATAERQVNAYTAGSISRAELYAPGGDCPSAGSIIEPLIPPRSPRPHQNNRPRKPRRDVPNPKPYRSLGGPPCLNIEALGSIPPAISSRWPDDYVYVPDVIMATTLRLEAWIMRSADY